MGLAAPDEGLRSWGKYAVQQCTRAFGPSRLAAFGNDCKRGFYQFSLSLQKCFGATRTRRMCDIASACKRLRHWRDTSVLLHLSSMWQCGSICCKRCMERYCQACQLLRRSFKCRILQHSASYSPGTSRRCRSSLCVRDCSMWQDTLDNCSNISERCPRSRRSYLPLRCNGWSCCLCSCCCASRLCSAHCLICSRAMCTRCLHQRQACCPSKRRGVQESQPSALIHASHASFLVQMQPLLLPRTTVQSLAVADGGFESCASLRTEPIGPLGPGAAASAGLHSL